MDTPNAVAVIGLGQMGSRMAARLLEQGWEVRVYNRTDGRAAALVLRGATASISAADAVAGAKLVITSLRGDDAEQQMVERFIDVMPAGAVHISTSTLAPGLAAALEGRHLARGTRFLSVPVQGRPEAAETGQLMAWASGPRETFTAAEPLLRALAGTVHWLGDFVESGPAVKLAVNMLMFANVALMAETFDYLDRCGIDPGPVGRALASTVFAAPLFHAIVAGLGSDHTSAGTNIHGSLKDLAMFVGRANTVHAAVPVARAVHQQYAVAVERGLGHLAQTGVLLSLIDTPIRRPDAPG